MSVLVLSTADYDNNFINSQSCRYSSITYSVNECKKICIYSVVNSFSGIMFFKSKQNNCNYKHMYTNLASVNNDGNSSEFYRQSVKKESY